jgi:hypothetical protein
MITNSLPGSRRSRCPAAIYGRGAPIEVRFTRFYGDFCWVKRRDVE